MAKGSGSGGRSGGGGSPNPEAVTTITSGRRNAAQAELISRAERYLNAQSSTARRTNKTLRALQNSVNAARSVTGQASQWASEAERQLAAVFFREGF